MIMGSSSIYLENSRDTGDLERHPVRGEEQVHPFPVPSASGRCGAGLLRAGHWRHLLYLRGVDDNEVGRDGGEEEADGQEGRQRVEEIIERVLGAPAIYLQCAAIVLEIFTEYRCNISTVCS